MKAFRYFNDARFNFYKDDFVVFFCITKHLLNVSSILGSFSMLEPHDIIKCIQTAVLE